MASRAAALLKTMEYNPAFAAQYRASRFECRRRIAHHVRGLQQKRKPGRASRPPGAKLRISFRRITDLRATRKNKITHVVNAHQRLLGLGERSEPHLFAANLDNKVRIRRH